MGCPWESHDRFMNEQWPNTTHTRDQYERQVGDPDVNDINERETHRRLVEDPISSVFLPNQYLAELIQIRCHKSRTSSPPSHYSACPNKSRGVQHFLPSSIRVPFGNPLNRFVQPWATREPVP